MELSTPLVNEPHSSEVATVLVFVKLFYPYAKQTYRLAMKWKSREASLMKYCENACTRIQMDKCEWEGTTDGAERSKTCGSTACAGVYTELAFSSHRPK